MKADIFSTEWCDIVFDGRNKDYGAYMLRKIRPKNSFFAILLAIGIIVLGTTAPLIIDLLSSATDDDALKITEVTTLAEPPPIDKNEPPPPPVEPPPPLKNTVKFTPPVIVEDKLAVDTVRAQDELKEVEVGTKTQEGDSVGGVDPSLLEGEKIIEEAPQIFTIVEQMPEFPGGEAKMMEYIYKNIKYPQMAKENGISGTVYVNFVINQEGKVSDVKVMRGPGGGLDQEAIRVVQSMPPWKAGKQNGRSVSVYFNLPIKFVLKN